MVFDMLKQIANFIIRRQMNSTNVPLCRGFQNFRRLNCTQTILVEDTVGYVHVLSRTRVILLMSSFMPSPRNLMGIPVPNILLYCSMLHFFRKNLVLKLFSISRKCRIVYGVKNAVKNVGNKFDVPPVSSN